MAVNHAYGPQAGEMAATLAGAGKNVGLVYVDVAGVSRRAVLKGVAKGLVVGRVKDPRTGRVNEVVVGEQGRAQGQGGSGMQGGSQGQYQQSQSQGQAYSTGQPPVYGDEKARYR